MKKMLLLTVVLVSSFYFKSDAQLLKKIKENLPGKKNSSSGQQQSEVDEKFDSKDYGPVKYKLDEGEKLLVGEECVFFNGSFEQFQFITSKGGKFYFHNHDRVSGPFDKPPMDSLKDCMDKQPNQNSEQDKNRQATLQKYQTVNTASTTPYGLKIGNKSYGPYNGIMNMYVSSDESKFYAIVLMIAANGNDMDYYLVSHKGKTKLPGLAASWVISPSGNVCAIPLTESQMKGSSEPTINPNESVYLLFDDGHKKGPIPDFYGDQAHLFTDGGKYVQLKHTDRKILFVDGKPALNFSKEITHFESLILNENATAGVYFDIGSLYFSDGASIENEAIRPHLAKQGGKTFVRWMAIDKQGNIYDCQREL